MPVFVTVIHAGVGRWCERSLDVNAAVIRVVLIPRAQRRSMHQSQPCVSRGEPTGINLEPEVKVWLLHPHGHKIDHHCVHSHTNTSWNSWSQWEWRPGLLKFVLFLVIHSLVRDCKDHVWLKYFELKTSGFHTHFTEHGPVVQWWGLLSHSKKVAWVFSGFLPQSKDMWGG